VKVPRVRRAGQASRRATVQVKSAVAPPVAKVPVEARSKPARRVHGRKAVRGAEREREMGTPRRMRGAMAESREASALRERE
jgi:hypothetical protein